MKKWLIALALSLGICCGATAAESKTVNFSFLDISNKTIHLSQYRGSWVLINFYAPWCPLCWGEVPALNRLAAMPHIVVIGIMMDYGPGETDMQKIIDRHDMHFTDYVLGGSRRDQSGSWRQIGPVDFYPTSYLYSPRGDAIMFIPGMLKEQKILDFIATHKTEG